MDLIELRSALTVLSFLAFMGIVFWAYGGRSKGTFDRAARSVLEEQDDGNESVVRGGK
jgi:cytochrome c oxidase cbb3-type subunit 4